ncbi:hypothetical protein GIB67_031157 [Kingdonia uniflora]|uniref:Uncharacterized protein n=1 Tax=Kingdonia uniflora TaxID=39325 RepID=A0A7J7NKT7_9MAGN|nr:hypothetical protein GIB67_031157 [Kingdonia uniflora]
MKLVTTGHRQPHQARQGLYKIRPEKIKIMLMFFSANCSGVKIGDLQYAKVSTKSKNRIPTSLNRPNS